MSNIERCWITPGEFGGTKVLYDEADANAWIKAGFDVTGPWVLEAQQHRGAVDLDAATDRVEALMIRSFGARRTDETREQARRLAHAAIGGQ